MTATECFGLNELGRVTVHGIEWVLYDDGQLADATLADDYDDVPGVEYAAREVRTGRDDDGATSWTIFRGEHPLDTDDGRTREQAEDDVHDHNTTRYSLWCAATTTANRATLAAILRALGIEHVHSGAHGYTDQGWRNLPVKGV